LQTYRHYIDGKWVDPHTGKWFDTVNPYTGEAWAQIAHGDAADVDRAVKAARNAFEGEPMVT